MYKLKSKRKNVSIKEFIREIKAIISYNLFWGLKTGVIITLLSIVKITNVAARERPNIVLIVIDDWGWTDAGCYGSTFYETPNIDKLASEGMRFTDAYAAHPVCSPTRASIMSGKNPGRINITQWIRGSADGVPYVRQLPLSEVTVAEAFKDSAYSTFFAGKWHLCENGNSETYFPRNQGFDINKGGCHWGSPSGGKRYFSPYNNPQLSNGSAGEYLTDRLTDESLTFIGNNKTNEFFVDLCHYAVHTPIQAKSADISYFKGKADTLPAHTTYKNYPSDGVTVRVYQDNYTYAAMVKSVDESIGRIMDKLETEGISENTIIILTSDNGGFSTSKTGKHGPTCNTPLRYGKGWCYEGGIRVPLIIKWPGKVIPGSECSVPVISHDFYPTMLEMADLPLRPEQHIDGVSLVPLLQQTGSIDRECIYWHYPHNHGSGHKPSSAVRCGDYKLIEFFNKPHHAELYNLKDDIGETNDLASQNPNIYNELLTKLYEWRIEVDARMHKDWKSLITVKVKYNNPNSTASSELELNIKQSNFHNSSLVLSYNLPVSSMVDLNIYNTSGKKVRTLVNEYQNKGKKSLIWHGKDDNAKRLTSGAYIFIMEAGDKKQNKKRAFIK